MFLTHQVTLNTLDNCITFDTDGTLGLEMNDNIIKKLLRNFLEKNYLDNWYY